MKQLIAGVIGVILGVVLTLLALAAGWLDPIRPVKDKKDEWGKFPGTPKAELLDDGRELRLLEDFAYVDPRGKVWAAKKDSVVDGASIPQLFWSVTGGPLEGQFRNASIVHDTACVSKTEPWEDVHFMFYEACRCGGVLENKAKVLYAAVYHFGPRWELKTIQEAMFTTDHKGEKRKKVVTVHRSIPISPPTPQADALKKLEQFVSQKNPSLEELRKIDPAKL